MTKAAPSLKATAQRRRETDGDPFKVLKRAQADYQAARAGFRKRQRQILQDLYRAVSPLIEDDDACGKFMNRAAVAKFAGPDGHLTNTDRSDVWFHALAYVYRASSRERRKRASKHASALRLLYDQNVDADQIAATIKKRGGIQKLADEAAKDRRIGSKQSADQDDAEPAADDNEKTKLDDAEGTADADQAVRFSISDALKAKIRQWRGKRIKIIARVSTKVDGKITVLRAVKLKP